MGILCASPDLPGTNRALSSDEKSHEEGFFVGPVSYLFVAAPIAEQGLQIPHQSIFREVEAMVAGQGVEHG